MTDFYALPHREQEQILKQVLDHPNNGARAVALRTTYSLKIKDSMSVIYDIYRDDDTPVIKGVMYH